MRILIFNSVQRKSKRKNIFAKNTSKYDSLGKKVGRFIVGIISLLLIYLVLNYIGDNFVINKSEDIISIFKYIKYTIVIFWGIAGVPALFKLFKLA